jgi:hypothetical protein
MVEFNLKYKEKTKMKTTKVSSRRSKIKPDDHRNSDKKSKINFSCLKKIFFIMKKYAIKPTGALRFHYFCNCNGGDRTNQLRNKHIRMNLT